MYYFVTLDTNFNLWNYFFYLVLLVFISLNFKKIKGHLRPSANRFYILLALCLSIPFVLLTIAQTKLGWYLTPVIPLVAIVTVVLLESVSKKFPIFKFLFMGLLAFTLAMQFIFINSVPVTRGTLLQEEKDRLLNASSIYWYRGNFEMDWLAYFRWYAHEVKPIDQQHLKALTVNDSFLIAGSLDAAIEDFFQQHPEVTIKKTDDHFIAFPTN